MRLSYLLAALSVCCMAVRSAGQAAPIGSDSIFDGFSQPYDVALDSSNNLYVADHNLQLVLKIASTGGTPLVYYNNTGTSTAIAYPDGLCLGPNSPPDVYVVDGNNQRVIKFNNAGQVQSIIPASAATPAFNYPWNCAVDANSNLFVSNTVGQGINVFNAQGTQTNFFNKTTPAFLYPNQIALDSTGANLYVAGRLTTQQPACRLLDALRRVLLAHLSTFLCCAASLLRLQQLPHREAECADGRAGAAVQPAGRQLPQRRGGGQPEQRVRD